MVECNAYYMTEMPGFQKCLKGQEILSQQFNFFFLSFFCRPPTPDEMNAIEQALAQGMKKEDLSWALFNSTEFLFVQ